MKTENKVVISALVAVFSWSTVATAFKISLDYLTWFEMLLVSCSTALFVFSLNLTYQKKWHLVANVLGKYWSILAGMGLLTPFAYYSVLFQAYSLLPAQIAQPINYAWPIVLLILLSLFGRQSVPKWKYVGMFISLVGVVVISCGGNNIEDGAISVEGLLLAVLSAVLWAVYWMLGSRLRSIMDGGIILFGTFLFSTFYLWCVACFVEIHFNISGILSAMNVGGFEMGIPFVLFGYALQKTNNPVLINQMCYLSPFVSLLLIDIVLDEQIVCTTYIGLILIVVGIIFNQRKLYVGQVDNTSN